MKSRIGASLATVLVAILPMTAQVAGTGTTNHVPRWVSTSNLEDSILVQSGGKIGLGAGSPAALLDVQGKAGTTNMNSGNAPTAMQVKGVPGWRGEPAG